VTPYPSSSGNVVEYLGIERRTTTGDITEIIELYKEHLVDRFFVLMSPSDYSDETKDQLLRGGLAPFQGTTYPTLARDLPGEPVSPAKCDFRVTKLRADDAAFVASSKILEPWLQSALLEPEFDLWVATDPSITAADNAVARAIGITVDGVTYLAGMTTLPEYRGRGAQSVMIRRRMEDGLTRGSTCAVSETLTMLTTSLNNLKRAGFRIAYTKTAYEWRSR